MSEAGRDVAENVDIPIEALEEACLLSGLLNDDIANEIIKNLEREQQAHLTENERYAEQEEALRQDQEAELRTETDQATKEGLSSTMSG